MSLYKLYKENNKYVVFELPTNKVVDSFDEYADAQNFYKHLKNGGGFEGWTPDYITNPGAFPV